MKYYQVLLFVAFVRVCQSLLIKTIRVIEKVLLYVYLIILSEITKLLYFNFIGLSLVDCKN